MSISVGAQIGRYEIVSLLATGGMGEVYLADDTQLDRRVALKILPAQLARDETAMSRFFLEAKAAAKLSHPNIAHVYEVGQDGGVSFIAMEYVEGQTLRQRLASGPMSAMDAIEACTQIASALAEAHSAGIVHRDIKPENILLRADATVKVLDFGVAKLTEKFFVAHAADAERTTMVQTGPNLVIGTVNYMSPEQARGFQVDARTDIFSLGIVLYEMLTASKPFDGASGSDVVAAILNRDPPPLASQCEVPGALEWIVTKALMKKPDERYQTAREMMVDLRRLRQRLELKAGMERVSGSGASGAVTVATQVSPNYLMPTVGAREARATSSAEYLVNEIKRHKRGAALVAMVLVLIFSGLAYGVYRLASRNAPTAAKTLKVVPLTNNGKSGEGAISPDGKYMAYVMEGGLWVKHIATLSETLIVAPAPNVEVLAPVFSPDGSYVYYLRAENGGGALFQTAVFGGVARKILSDVAPSPVTFAPDGQRFAFVRHDAALVEYSLVVANKDGSNEQVLASRQDPNYISRAAWSPNGKVVAFSTGNFDPAGFHWNLAEVSVETKAERLLSPQKWWWIGGLAWLADGSALLMAAREIKAPDFPIWHISATSGEARKITNDSNHYFDLSLTADSQLLVASRTDMFSNIWVAPASDPNRAAQITSGKENGASGLAWTPSGKLVFPILGPTHREIWIVNQDGSSKQLLADVAGHDLSVSPDGRYIVFDSVQAGTFNVWRINADGSNPTRLTTGAVEGQQTISPDSRWVVYTAGTEDNATIWRVSIEGGQPEQVTNKRARGPAASPDGKLLACYFPDETTGNEWKIAILPFAGGDPIKSFKPPQGGIDSNSLRWTPDGRAIAFINSVGTVSNIWIQPLAGGPPRQITNFKSDQVLYFDYSRDGRQIAFSRGVVSSDIVTLSDFR